MLTTAIVIAALAGSAVAVWGWHEVTTVQQRLGAFENFDGMHFER